MSDRTDDQNPTIGTIAMAGRGTEGGGCAVGAVVGSAADVAVGAAVGTAAAVAVGVNVGPGLDPAVRADVGADGSADRMPPNVESDNAMSGGRTTTGKATATTASAAIVTTIVPRIRIPTSR